MNSKLKINNQQLSINVDYCPQHLYLSWPSPRPCLSSAVLNGGYCQTTGILNLHVDGGKQESLPEETLQDYANAKQWPDATVGLMTAASMSSMRHRHTVIDGEHLDIWLTAGLSNARAAGDPADWQAESIAPPAGTINTILVTSLQLSDATMAELIMILTEAKCAVMHELRIQSPVSANIATGTGTDSTVIVAGNGRGERWAGKHTLLGEAAANLMMDVLRSSLSQDEQLAV